MDSKKLNSDGFYYFRLAEFDSPDLPGSGNFIDRNFVSKLDFMRAYHGWPIFITSGFRTRNHNAVVGGDVDSSHLGGYAADISVTNSMDRYSLLYSALCAGISRIGVYPSHLHLDVDPKKAANLIWVKPFYR